MRGRGPIIVIAALAQQRHDQIKAVIAIALISRHGARHRDFMKMPDGAIRIVWMQIMMGLRVNTSDNRLICYCWR